MPEAPVHIDGYSCPPKNDVGTSSALVQRRNVDAIPQPQPVKLAAQQELRLRVALAGSA